MEKECRTCELWKARYCLGLEQRKEKNKKAMPKVKVYENHCGMYEKF